MNNPGDYIVQKYAIPKSNQFRWEVVRCDEPIELLPGLVSPVMHVVKSGFETAEAAQEWLRQHKEEKHGNTV